MKRLKRSTRKTVRFEFEGKPLQAQEGDTVAAALLLSGHKTFRTTPHGTDPRGPLCMMGVCFDCLVEIDGMPNLQACMLELRDGMRIARQHGKAAVGKVLPNPAGLE